MTGCERVSERNGITAITETIRAEAQAAADEITAAAQAEAQAISADYEAQAKAVSESALADAKAKAEAAVQRAASQGEMDKRKMLLAAKQECVSGAFDKALEKLCALSEEERALLMVKSALRYQTEDAQYIFNAADRSTVGPLVVETVNALFKKQQLGETFSGSFVEQVKKLFTGGPATYTATLSDQVGGFAGGFILKQGDIESNCTFEVLIAGVREDLEGETSAILFG